jgi:hypothetical protein
MRKLNYYHGFIINTDCDRIMAKGYVKLNLYLRLRNSYSSSDLFFLIII